MTQRKIRAVYMRGGTSRCLVFREEDLPHPGPARDRILLSALGSPDPYGRQLDGLGGGISSLSKACIVGAPTHPDADVDYTFAQVDVKAPVVEYHGNCGNCSSSIGPFAIDEGLVRAQEGETIVRVHNTNTKKLIHARVPVIGGELYGQGSSREVAAIAPMFLGVRAVIVKSFARIHRANLVNWGIVPLTFDDPAAYDTIERDDRLRMDDLRAALATSARVRVVNTRTGAAFTASCVMTPRERDILLAGGILAHTRSRQPSRPGHPQS